MKPHERLLMGPLSKSPESCDRVSIHFVVARAVSVRFRKPDRPHSHALPPDDNIGRF